MRSIDGRQLLLIASPVVIGLSALVGAMIGSNAAQRDAEVVVFGFLQLPPSGLWVGVFAAAMATTVLVTLFGSVELVSRVDDDSP